MPKTIMIPFAAAVLLTGCADSWNPVATPTPPKLAAELCNGYQGGPVPSAEQAPIVADYRAGNIPFAECMKRLRG